MARSLASKRPPLGVAAALAALSLAASAPRPQVSRVPAQALASHARAATSRWGEDPVRIYDALERTALAPRDAIAVARTVLEESLDAALDPRVVLAVIRVESGFQPRAVSPAGALGLMQLMPPTLRQVAARSGLDGADPFDPVGNVRAGVRYLTALVAAFGDLELALMAYNAGPARIRAHLRAGGIPVRFHRYPKDVLRLARSAAAAPAARPTPRLAAAHAPATGQAEAVPALVAQLPWFAGRELPQDGGVALPTIRRGLRAPAVLLAA